LAQHAMKISVIKKEGTMASDVITGLGSVAQACAILLGMTYALNFSYLHEAFQNLSVEHVYSSKCDLKGSLPRYLSCFVYKIYVFNEGCHVNFDV
uniref:Uncharacterized protein n=1 Tax=Hucho hucho TaxID=62062 RepID=A0A4W5M7S7_9TELE